MFKILSDRKISAPASKEPQIDDFNPPEKVKNDINSKSICASLKKRQKLRIPPRTLRKLSNRKVSRGGDPWFLTFLKAGADTFRFDIILSFSGGSKSSIWVFFLAGADTFRSDSILNVLRGDPWLWSETRRRFYGPRKWIWPSRFQNRRGFSSYDTYGPQKRNVTSLLLKQSSSEALKIFHGSGKRIWPLSFSK